MASRRLATVLFTDIVGSTERLADLGDAGWSELLDRHRRMVRAQIEHFGGREVTTTGDGFLVVFDDPGPAIRCAVAIRDAARALEISVRTGVHTGEIEHTPDGDVGGIAVHLGARVMDAASAGEILVTGTVKDLVQGSGFCFEDKGTRSLSGVPGRWSLFAVAGGGAGSARSGRLAWLGSSPSLAVGLAALGLGVVAAFLLLRGVAPPASEEEPTALASASDGAFERSLAVLPLENLSPDPEDAYLAGAMTEEVTSALSKVPGLRVVSRTSATKFAGSDALAGAIAEELGVRYVLEGSVRRAGDQVAIVVQLIDGVTDEHVWAQRYERSMENIIGLQVEIARQIADELRSSFTEQERERILAGMTDDPVAYDLFLRAIEGTAFLVRDDVEETIGLLEEAVERDPGFAQAWVALAFKYRFASTYRGPEWADSSRVALDRALEHVEETSRRAVISAYRAWLTGEEPKVATAAVRAAMGTHPADPLLVALLAQLEYFRGDLVAATRWGLHARTLDPLNAERSSFLGGVYFLLNLQPAAEEAYSRALKLDPQNTEAWLELAFLRLDQGRYADAFAILDSMNARGVNPWEQLLPGVFHLWAGEIDRAQASLEAGFGERPWEEALDWTPYLVHVRFLSGDSIRGAEIARQADASARNLPLYHESAYLLLELAAARGDADLAIERLRTYTELGGRGDHFLRGDPTLASVRSKPGFQAALETLQDLTERDSRRVKQMLAAEDPQR